MPDEQTRIVVADDDAEIARILQYKLERTGYTVEVCENGRQALEVITATRPSLAVLDVMMPVMDGFEVLMRLKEAEGTRNIPVIMLTARELEDDVLRAFELGAVDYITKPFSPSEIVARVKATLGNGQA